MRPRGMIRAMPRRLALSLDAVIVAVTAEQPRILTTTQTGKAAIPALPFGPLDTDQDATLEFGLRRWVAQQTGRDLGYVEQLYTFLATASSSAIWAARAIYRWQRQLARMRFCRDG